ncbi:unnamed protein product [Blepharisma stoltei]|uniref:LNR domain-containing protein n=1 Tax=Blepharisma stoltei TaxID=1481888 RepID=A0AAU9K3W0_9CILI|nr:unnamed protein product [Blepharisma stoltei]
MTPSCNFDTLLIFDGQNIKENSDCYKTCINSDGCDPENLGNGICDDSCNTQNCGFDWGDCTCAPGCLNNMLGNGNCDEACNNWECDLDNHDCGACAEGCFPIMLGNGLCEPECNNEDCLYDYKDCQCANGCSIEDYGKCKPECMVANCNYDNLAQFPNNQCKNTSLAIFSSYQQIIRNNFSYVTHLEDCYKASNYSCTLEKALDFDLYSLKEECNYLECNYGNGYLGSWIYSCYRAYGDSNSCLTCPNDFYQKYILIDGDCWGRGQLSWSPSTLPDGSLIELPLNDTSSSKNPHIYFICPNASSNPESGDGTYFFPFQSLTYALYNINYKHSVVYLLDCDGYNLTSYKISLISTNTDVLETIAFAGKSVKFTTLNNEKITIKRVIDDWNDNSHWGFGFYFENAISIEMNNLIFDWKNTIAECNNDNYCDYCPFVVIKSNAYYSDRGETINDFLASWCENDAQSIFLQLRYSNLLLKNVSFINFRTEFRYLLNIKNDSNVTLYNVTFDNIKVRNEYESWVIRMDGTGYGNFHYENGVVSRLNNGYELYDAINVKGFFNGTGINTIVFRNVKFQYNAVFKQAVLDLNLASLIFLHLFQAIWIDSCTFLYNLCDFGIVYIQQEFYNFPIEIDDNGVIIYSKISHVRISNSNFTSNYGRTGGVIYALYEDNNQNFLIENSSFTFNGIESGSLMHIESNYLNEMYLVDRKFNAILLDGSIEEGKYLAKWVKFQNSFFTNNYSGKAGIIEISRMANIQWEKLNMNSNGLSLSEPMNINSILMKFYIQNPLAYPKLNITNPTDINCESLSIVSDSINLNIERINIENNYCKYSSPCINISNTVNSIVKSSYFNQNKGVGSRGIALAFQGNMIYKIINSEFYFNVNYQYGSPGAISSFSSLLLHNCTFSSNAGTLYFGGQNLSIFSSDFDSNSSPGSNGGAVTVSMQQDTIDTSIFFISNTTFKNNSCSFSGGAIYIEKTTPLDLLLIFQIDSTDFFKNQAWDGSCIYIDSNVELTSNSSIIDCYFQENIASFSGTVSVSYLYGILIFEHCNFVKNKGIYSSGLNIAIGENTEENASKIFLNSCIFRLNSGNTTISMDNTNINSTLESYDSLFEFNVGSIFFLDYDYVFIKNSKIQHNISPNSGGALNLKNSAKFFSENTTYVNCSSNINGGAASISLKSQFICFSCLFSTNYAGSSGGVIYADSDAQFYISDSIISKNSCKNKGSAIFMASSLASSSINNTEISENYAYNEGLFFILSSQITISSSKILRNTALGKNPSLYIDDSDVIIADTTFSNQKGNQGCFIYMSTSYVNITNSAFSKGFSNSSGIAIHATSSKIEIYSSAFSDLFSSDTGGSIYLYEGSSLFIKESKFMNSSSSIDSYSSSITIENTLFKDHTNTAIYSSQIEELHILNSKFINGQGVNGGSIYCTQCNIISILDSWFISNLGVYGGAIYITNEADHPESSQITISSSNFQLNTASNGGAIWTNNINLHILSSVFYENKAETLIPKSHDIEDGIGGAIKVSCQSSNSICYFDISSNSFINNIASYNGGAISWDNSKPFFDNNHFENNSAIYGPDIASFPTMMIFLNNDTRSLQSKTMSKDRSILVLDNVASGQTNNPSLVFALVDDLYQIISTDTASQAQMQAIRADTVISGTTIVYAKNGIYYFDDYIISAKPGSSVDIDIVSSAINTQKMNTTSEILQMSKSFSIEVNLRLCDIGEATVGLVCEICPKGYYNIDLKKSKCSDCPKNAICYGNFSIVPKSGYWRDNNFTDKFWKCPYQPACLGSPDISNLSLTGKCDKGYENNMCHSCEYGYSRLYRNECQVCPDYTSNIFRWIGISTLLIFITIVILKTTRNSWYKPNSFSSIYIKIFWNYLQIIIITATYNLNWPFEVVQFFYIQTSLDYIGGQMFSFDCFLQSSYSKSVIYYIKILITSLTPFLAGLGCLMFWILVYKIKKKPIKEMWDDFISTAVVLLFLIHPSIIDNMFNVFSCKEINPGEYWLNVDLGIRCWDRDHAFYALLLALPTIIIWVVTIPLFCLMNLIKNRNYLGEMWMKKRYGFLCNGYEPKHYYWEFMILFYKVILIGCSAFLSNISANIQALSAALFFVLFLHLHSRNEPFSEVFFNKAETFSRLASLITILTGLCFLTADLGIVVTYILLVLLIFVNALFITYILAKFFLQFAIIDRIIMKIWKIFYPREKNNIVPDNENELNRSCKEVQGDCKKIESRMILSDNTKIGIIFKEGLSNSVEYDPFSSVRSISALN